MYICFAFNDSIWEITESPIFVIWSDLGFPKRFFDTLKIWEIAELPIFVSLINLGLPQGPFWREIAKSAIFVILRNLVLPVRVGPEFWAGFGRVLPFAFFCAVFGQVLPLKP